MLSNLVEARVVRCEIANHRIGEYTYEIPAAFTPVLDELLYR